MYLQVSGREVFEFRPELVDDDDAEAVDTRYASEDEEDDMEEVIIDTFQMYLWHTVTEFERLKCCLPSVQIITSYRQWLFHLALCDFILICSLWSSYLK